jgi:methylase of polypeptide subunit release factors
LVSAVEAMMDPQLEALVELGRHLQAQNYRFTTITPLSHDRVNSRCFAPEATLLTDIFGWSRPFRPAAFGPVAELLARANELEIQGNLVRSRVRFSTLAAQFYVHSSHPTTAADAVFFGPDTYRFARVIEQFLPGGPKSPTRIIDIGCGSGAGGIYAASLVSGDKPEIVLADINDKALRYSRVNCALNGTQQVTTFVKSDLFERIHGKANLIISNPPYLVDRAARAYRHGGTRGFDLSLRIAEQSVDRLMPGGRLILYTGTPVVGGVDEFLEALSLSFARKSQPFFYEEVDPDVFGEELADEAYSHADRIAAVALVSDAAQ